MNIEVAELEVLTGAGETLRELEELVLLIFTMTSNTLSQVYEFLRRKGFSVRLKNDNVHAKRAT
ncbi:MAG: hypothetical protein QXS32_07550 [Candidatus Nezhaarchaeales archaeon]